MNAAEAWERLEQPWREALELAWEAYAAGTVPVGAVVVGIDGEIVARGRNRIFEDAAPPQQLAGTRIAHAEINALAQLPSGRRWSDAALYTTLEPCPLCTGASLISSIGRVAYLVDDPVAGGITVQRISLQKLSGVLPVEGPLGGPFARISLALLASFIGEQDPSQFVAIAVAQERLAAARDDGAAVSRAGLRGLPLDKALPRLWDALAL